MLPTTMTAAVLHGPGDLRIETRPVPSVEPTDVAVDVAFCGICGTDLHYWDGWTFDAWLPNYDQPWVPGHEFTGTVVAVGGAVPDLTVGDRVVVEPRTPCQTCAPCRKGITNFCTSMRGMRGSGAWAEYTVVDYRNVVRFPEHLDPQLVSLTEPLGCVLRGFDRIDISRRRLRVRGREPDRSACWPCKWPSTAGPLACWSASPTPRAATWWRSWAPT